MTKGKGSVPQVWEHYGGDRGYRILRDMTPSELAKRGADQQAYEDMLARQAAYMSKRLAQVREEQPSDMKGCVFAKSCKLPDSVIDYHNPTGYIPTEALRDYGQFTLLGGRQADESGRIQLKSNCAPWSRHVRGCGCISKPRPMARSRGTATTPRRDVTGK